jgi:predicted lipoprotein
MNFKLSIPLIAFTILTFTNCKKKCDNPSALNHGEKGECEFVAFDKNNLLENLVYNYITPSLDQYVSDINTLHTSASNFESNPSISSLESLRNDWKEALLTWQDVALFNFGPSDFYVHNISSNNFPTNVYNLNQYINGGNTNISSMAFSEVKGFPALDYLLYQPNKSGQEIVDYFTNSNNAKQYLLAITTDLKNRGNNVRNMWDQEYIDEFISDENNSTGSSVSLIVNGFCQYFEKNLRSGKLGIPLDALNPDFNDLYPTHVECYYYGKSIPFAVRALEAVKKYFNGISYSSSEEDNMGLDDYIDNTGATADANTSLHDKIDNLLDQSISEFNALQDPLSDKVAVDDPAAHQLWTKLQELAILFKIDMTSALGVTIVYQDNDGD